MILWPSKEALPEVAGSAAENMPWLIRGEVEGSGRHPRPVTSTLLYSAPEGYMFDSMAVDGDGNVCVATIGSGSQGAGGISVRH